MTTIQYSDNGGMTITANGPYAMHMNIYCGGSILTSVTDRLLSGVDHTDKPVLDAIAESLKTVFQKNLGFHFEGFSIKAERVSKVELCNQDGKVLATILNEAKNEPVCV